VAGDLASRRLAAVGLIALICVLWAGAGVAQSRGHDDCTLVGSQRADRLKGTPGRDVICAFGGADKIIGLGGPDLLEGGPGKDRILGGPGADTLSGGPGNDRLEGGAGRDRLLGGPGRNVCVGNARYDVTRGCLLTGRPRRRSAPGFRPLCPTPCGSVTGQIRNLSPAVNSVWISPQSADVSEGPVEAIVHVAAWDWEEEISTVQTLVTGPGFERETSLTPTNQLHFEFEGSIVLPAGSPVGIYAVTRVAVGEPDGTSLVLDQAALEAHDPEEERLLYGTGRELVLYEGPDNTGPELTNLSISPRTANTSSGPALVRAAVQATDDLSGVDEIQASFEMPNGGYGFSAPRLSGNALSGEWIQRIDLPRYAAQGTWTLKELRMWDRAGNVSGFSTAELEARGFPVTFDQTGPGDTTPPSILGLQISPQALHAGKGESTVNFDVHLADNLSGINSDHNCSGWVEYQSLAQPSFQGTATPGFPLSGDDLDGVLRVATSLPNTAPFGTYEVTGIETCDRAFNSTQLSGPALQAKGWDLTFENLP